VVPPNGTDRTKMGGDIFVLSLGWGRCVSKSSLQPYYFTEKVLNRERRAIKFGKLQNFIDNENDYHLYV